jgi:hypothetical protein
VSETSAPDANVDGLCPTPADVMCASTRELPSEEQRAVSRHVSHCSYCQAELRESQGFLDLIAANSAYLFQSENTPTRRTAPTKRIAFAARWLSLAAALVVIVALFGGFLRSPDVAHADEILARLAQHEHRASSLDPWYVWIVDAPSRGLTAQGSIAARALLDNAQDAQAADALLHEHGFALRHPFRIAAIQAWSARLAQRRDRVVYRDGTIVVTITGRDALRELEMVIDPAEFIIVSQRWMFLGVGQLECRRPTPNDVAPTKTDSTSTTGAGR